MTSRVRSHRSASLRQSQSRQDGSAADSDKKQQTVADRLKKMWKNSGLDQQTILLMMK
jgi:hypothetical protein